MVPAARCMTKQAELTVLHAAVRVLVLLLGAPGCCADRLLISRGRCRLAPAHDPADRPHRLVVGVAGRPHSPRIPPGRSRVVWSGCATMAARRSSPPPCNAVATTLQPLHQQLATACPDPHPCTHAPEPRLPPAPAQLSSSSNHLPLLFPDHAQDLAQGPGARRATRRHGRQGAPPEWSVAIHLIPDPVISSSNPPPPSTPHPIFCRTLGTAVPAIAHAAQQDALGKDEGDHVDHAGQSVHGCGRLRAGGGHCCRLACGAGAQVVRTPPLPSRRLSHMN